MMKLISKITNVLPCMPYVFPSMLFMDLILFWSFFYNICKMLAGQVEI